MKLVLFVLALFFSISFVASTVVRAADQKASAFVLCKNQKNVRTIKILPDAMAEQPSGAAKAPGEKATNGCAVSYSKGGVDEVVGTNRSLDTCKSILKSIQYNLETTKWSCRSVQTAVVTTSKESIAQ